MKKIGKMYKLYVSTFSSEDGLTSNPDSVYRNRHNLLVEKINEIIDRLNEESNLKELETIIKKVEKLKKKPSKNTNHMLKLGYIEALDSVLELIKNEGIKEASE